MEQEKVELLNAVALTEAMLERGLRRGQVGTVVEQLAPDVFEVEFSDTSGRALQVLAVPADRLLILHHEAAEAA